jgi:hypothetical protein
VWHFEIKKLNGNEIKLQLKTQAVPRGKHSLGYKNQSVNAV